jgi:hypothetical protein
VIVMLALVLLGPAAVAVAGGRELLADAQDGRVDACYSRAEFRDGLRLARADQRLYGFALDAIKEAQISNVAVDGRPCGSRRTAPSRAVAVDAGATRGVWGTVAVVVIAGAAAAGLVAHRARRDRG